MQLAIGGGLCWTRNKINHYFIIQVRNIFLRVQASAHLSGRAYPSRLLEKFNVKVSRKMAVRTTIDINIIQVDDASDQLVPMVR